MQTGDNRYYLNTTTLDSITLPTSSVSMNSYAIVNCADPTNNQDVATKFYVDLEIASIQTDRISNAINPDSTLIANQTEMTIGIVPLNMNTQLITHLQTPIA